MEIIIPIVFSILININSVYLNPIPTVDSKIPWGIDEVFTAGGLILKFKGTWISENQFIYPRKLINGIEYVVFNVKTNSTTTYIPADKLEKYKNAEFTLSDDKKKFLIAYDKRQVFRHSSTAKYDVYDIENELTYNIADGKMLQHSKFSPISDRVAYVLDNNIYVYKLIGETIQITKNGVVGRIYNGVPDWVYEEEVFSGSSAIWWSPNGEKLAYAHFIDDEVKIFKYFIYGEPSSLDSQYPQEIDIRYPKPGTPNPDVSLYVFNMNDMSKGSVKLMAPTNLITKDHILQSVSWSTVDKVIALWENRRQNRGIIVEYETINGGHRVVKDISEPKGWLMTMDLNCENKGQDKKTCNMIDWIGNWMQIWQIDLQTGQNLVPKSFGNFTVMKIYGQRNDAWFYQATLEGQPSQHHVYKQEKCLSCDIFDSEGESCTEATASFSTDLSYMALSCLGPNPNIISIYETDTMNVVKVWETNENFRTNTLSKKLMPQIKNLKTKVEGDFEAVIKMYLPPDLNWENPNPDKKYPLVVYVYSGPNSAKIKDEFSVGWHSYMVTARNFIYVEIEGRGTGNKGKDILYAINNNLGTLEIQDQIDVTRYLQNEYNFIDKTRTAIWGWSYGGYATAKVMATDDQKIFQCGVSVAPVTSWNFYDTIYTERYMGLPVWHDNLRGYTNGGLLKEDTRSLNNFKNHDFLLMHGVADDNVHFQQSLQLSKILQRNNIDFEEMMYPDENHSIQNLKSHLYRTMDHFLLNCFNITAEN